MAVSIDRTDSPPVSQLETGGLPSSSLPGRNREFWTRGCLPRTPEPIPLEYLFSTIPPLPKALAIQKIRCHFDAIDGIHTESVSSDAVRKLLCDRGPSDQCLDLSFHPGLVQGQLSCLRPSAWLPYKGRKGGASRVFPRLTAFTNCSGATSIPRSITSNPDAS